MRGVRVRGSERGVASEVYPHVPVHVHIHIYSVLYIPYARKGKKNMMYAWMTLIAISRPMAMLLNSRFSRPT